MGRINFKRKGRLSDLPNFKLQPKSLIQDLKPVSYFFKITCMKLCYPCCESLKWQRALKRMSKVHFHHMVRSAFIRMLMLKKKKKPLKNNQSFKKSELKNDFDSHLPVFIQSIYFNHLIFFSHRFSSASLSPYSHLPSLCRMNIFSLFFFFFTLNWLCTSSPLWLPSFTNRTEIWVKMT